MRPSIVAALVVSGLVLSPQGWRAHAAGADITSSVAALPTSVMPPPIGKGVPRTATPADLGAVGYVEEEFLVAGKANVYQYDSTGAVVVKTPAMNYTTRIMVRRPSSPRRFSGTLHVETSHPQYGIDFVWSRTTDYVVANGDALVSITTRRSEASAIEQLKKFDPVRYAPIDFIEDGLNWDIIGQIGRLLRTKLPANPLHDFDVKRVYASGWSGGGALLLFYISDGFHERLRMPGGGPIFDGYLVGEPSGYPKINSTSPPLPNTDARQKVRSIDVPVISLHTHPQEAYRRRADGNQRNDRYRVYEVAGAAHNNVRLPRIYMQSEEAFRAEGCVSRSRFPMHHFFKSTLARLNAWAARGVTPPASQRITLAADSAPLLDVHGNPAGGVRSSYLDVPTARYFTSATGEGNGACTMDGATEGFSREKLVSLYRDRDGYVSRASKRIGELERDGWLLAADAKELRDEAAQFAAVFAQTPTQTPAMGSQIPPQLPGIGIAAKKPVFGGAPKSAPWGIIGDVVKAALQPYGYDVQVCYNCAQADAPRYVGDARIPSPIPANWGAGIFTPGHYAQSPHGRVELGATSLQNFVDAYHGTGNYQKDGPRKQLRLLANIASPLYVIVAAKRSTGITDLAQLKDRRGPLKLVIGQPYTDIIFSYYGLSMESLKAAGISFAPETLPAQRAGADLIIYQGNLQNSPEWNIWYESSQRDDLVYIQLPEDLLAKMMQELPNFERREIPVGMLRGLDTPIKTVARTGTVVYTRADIPDNFAYLVAKALDEQQDLFQWTMGHYHYIRQRVAKAADVPLHPGAARYYRERKYLP